MIGLVQRVLEARVSVDGECIGKIGKGALLLLGVESTDSPQSANKLVDKLLKFRMFADENGKMNLNIQQTQGELLVVSQFTLVADTRKGNRPGFSKGASPELGETLYQQVITKFSELYQPVQSGRFGADMQVSLINDGPVTFLIEQN